VFTRIKASKERNPDVVSKGEPWWGGKYRSTHHARGPTFSVIKKPWGNRGGVGRLPKGNLDVVELSIGKDVLAAYGRVLGVFGGQSHLQPPDPEMYWTGFPPYLCKAGNIDVARFAEIGGKLVRYIFGSGGCR